MNYINIIWTHKRSYNTISGREPGFHIKIFISFLDEISKNSTDFNMMTLK